MKKIVNVLMVIIAGGLLWAQPGKPKGPGGQYSERMEMMMIWKLTDYLELTEDQAEKLFPKMRAHQRVVRQLRKDEMEFWRPFKEKMVDNQELSKKDFDKIIDHISTMDMEKSKERLTFVKGTEKFLSPTQQVKLLTFEGSMRQEAQKKIKDRYRPNMRGGKMKGKRRF